MPLTRRRPLLAAVLALLVSALQAGHHREFWQSEDPATWDNDEKATLLGNSPWAREGVLQLETGGGRPSPDGGAGAWSSEPAAPNGMPRNVAGSSGTVPIGQPVPPRPSAPGSPVQFGVLARWETAEPVRLAGVPELPAGTAGFYVIRLRGMPLLPPGKGSEETIRSRNQAMLVAIKEQTRLERKDGSAISCTHMFTGSGDAASEVLLFFPRGENPISAGEKWVTLESRFAPFHLSIRFVLKDMVFHGRLAL